MLKVGIDDQGCSRDTELCVGVENDWQVLQDVPESLLKLNLSTEKRYGFLDMYSGYFRYVSHTDNELNELGVNAENCAPDERRRRRIKHEDAKFDEEHYM